MNRKNKLVKLKKIFISLIFISFLSSCGFHLRGLGPSLEESTLAENKIYLAVTSDDDLLFRQIQRDIQFSDAIVVDDAKQSDWHLVVLFSEVIKNSIGVDRSGRTNEYEIQLNISYIIKKTLYYFFVI